MITVSPAWKVRLCFLFGLFTPFVAIEFLPWWLGVPIAIFSFLYIFVALAMAKKIKTDSEKDTIDT
jgi:amino acid permease